MLRLLLRMLCTCLVEQSTTTYDEPTSTSFRYCYCYYYYTVSQKSTPNIFDCDLKTNYQILIIFGTNIPDKTCHQMTIQFPT